ncbi:hypothetical protein SPRG_18005 [Saprolegnia parasitica CBS 223.65]|uniref:Uncharacterized protein n=1 Tax=Saprolegnia parasitica (strain CBS 223.65) TaxID=695850 RepID=A0A067BDM6_SAPPC|nr:hypothetical protein SPRG_18005 [Saprolegnia parasitica CBS 223.65]KDO16469.1 hypothetical protein SPRG_18005 [Saprolegnia parasitica CBS 223.65]|eukprot:XP_012212822.1 hypothetical protein SPRG_18005 [Saprolegnia parasitica CBS 223.65]
MKAAGLLRLAVCATIAAASVSGEHVGCTVTPTITPTPATTTGPTDAPTTPIPMTTNAPATPVPTTATPGQWAPLDFGAGFSKVSGDSQGLCFRKDGTVHVWTPGQPLAAWPTADVRFASYITCANGVLYSAVDDRAGIAVTNLTTSATTTLETGRITLRFATDGNTLCLGDDSFRCATKQGDSFGPLEGWTIFREYFTKLVVAKTHALVAFAGDVEYATLVAANKTITNGQYVGKGTTVRTDGHAVCVTTMYKLSCATIATVVPWNWTEYVGEWSDFAVVDNVVYGVNRDGTVHSLQLA